MFKIGAFSKIAQVSCRLLRYYDEIGLFTPTIIDPQTGYRYYTAEQLPRLNRILALKDLGLSLEQVAHFLDDNISPKEIRGMLSLKKAQIQQDLRDDLLRLRNVEARLEQIESEGAIGPADVILKSTSAQPFFAIYHTVHAQNETINMFRAIHNALREGRIENAGQCVCVTHKDHYEWENLDLEMGFVLDSVGSTSSLILPDHGQMVLSELPAVEMMATIVHVGSNDGKSFNALGLWVERNGYEMVGPHREVFYKRYWEVNSPEDNVVEIQFPVESIHRSRSLSMIHI